MALASAVEVVLAVEVQESDKLPPVVARNSTTRQTHSTQEIERQRPQPVLPAEAGRSGRMKKGPWRVGRRAP